MSGGPPKDGIPPVDKPVYISVKRAGKEMKPSDVVFVVESDSKVRVYPRKVLVWHEIVNDEFHGKTGSVTYCPLTGSVIGFYGFINDKFSTFGTSGKLLNSNLVMYDRETDSYWPQVYGEAINGSQNNNKLDNFPVVWTTWEKASKAYPNADVLSRKTGFFRNYGNDPYGSYSDEGGYYNRGKPFFPIMHEDKRLSSKTVVVGVKGVAGESAILKSLVESKKVVDFNIGKESFVALYDNRLAAVRVYPNKSGLKLKAEGEHFSDSSGKIWSVELGVLTNNESGEKISPAYHFDVMWFAWSAFYPERDLVR